MLHIIACVLVKLLARHAREPFVHPALERGVCLAGRLDDSALLVLERFMAREHNGDLGILGRHNAVQLSLLALQGLVCLAQALDQPKLKGVWVG
jgi:hypothetical protein